MAVDAAGRVFVAWMSRRDADAGDENTEIYARRLDVDAWPAPKRAPDASPARVSTSDRLDALPMLIATPMGLALVWTESYFAGSVRHDLSAILYGEARDRGYRIAWMEGDSWSLPTASRPSPLVHERVTAIPGPAERELWLLYGRLNERAGRFWIPTLQRVTRSAPEEPFSLGATAPGWPLPSRPLQSTEGGCGVPSKSAKSKPRRSLHARPETTRRRLSALRLRQRSPAGRDPPRR